MNRGMIKKKTPEQRELDDKKERLSKLEEELLKKELDLSTIRIELRSFEARYMNKVGIYYAKLDEINAIIAELLAKQDPENIIAKENATHAREQAQASSRAAEDIKEEILHPKPAPSENIKKLFREAAKAMHPDLTMDEGVRRLREQYMKEINRAYESGNEDELLAIMQRWEGSPEAVEGEGPGVELIRVIRKIAQIEERLLVIDKEMEALILSELWILKSKVEAAERLGRDMLTDMADEIRAHIREAEQHLEILRADLE